MADMKTTKYIIGIDEVGRGPLAGPVAVCAFLLKNNVSIEEIFSPFPTWEELPKLKDSKKLSKKQREVWFEFLKEQKKEGNCDYSVSFVSPENIDKFGITKCIQKALSESLAKITTQDYSNSSRFTLKGSDATQNLNNFAPYQLKGSDADKNLGDSVSLSSFQIFLDGGLKAPIEYVNQETIIRGDELHPVISMASIMAKVTRDAVMTKYAKDYPEYSFERHSGYGTKAHYEAIKKYGQTPIHRKSFIH